MTERAAMSGHPAVGGFEFDGLRARVESSNPADLEWLDEFLCPQFGRIEGTGASCTVRFTQDRPRFERLVASRQPAAEQVIDCFALDQQVIRLPSWDGPDGARCILDEKFHCVYVIDADSSAVEIVASTTRRGPRIPAMRVIREFAMNHSLNRGHLFIHGSAVAVGESGIVIAGPSGSGKTTLLMHLLSLGDTTYVSNDRVLVRSLPEGSLLAGMPAITTLRSTTLDLYPSVHRLLTDSCFNHQRTIGECKQAAIPIAPWSDGRYGLTPAQFCRLMGVRSRATAFAKVVLMPRQTHRPGQIELQRLHPGAVARHLRESIFGIGCWLHETNVFALPADRAVTAADELQRRCRRLASSLPVFECRLGMQAYDDPSASRALVAGLLG